MVLAVILLAVLSMSALLTACGQATESGTAETDEEGTNEQASDAGSDDESEAVGDARNNDESEIASDDGNDKEMPKFKIGIIYYDITDTLGASVVRMATEFGETFNCEIQFLVANSTDENVAAVENLCSSGVDGIISCVVDAGLPRVLSICQEYDVYYGALCNYLNSDEVQQEIETQDYYKYWIGGCHEDEYMAGVNLVESLAEQGATSFGIIGFTPGISAGHDDRYRGFIDAIEANTDLKVASESLVSPTGRTEACNNMIALGTDMDALLVTGGGMDHCMQPLAAAGLTGKVLLGTINIGDGAEEALQNGGVQALLGGQETDVLFSLVNLYNYLTGTPLRDEPSDLLMNYLTVASVEDYNDYMEYIAGDILPYSKEELQQLMKAFNPDVTYEDLEAECAAYSLENVKARHK